MRKEVEAQVLGYQNERVQRQPYQQTQPQVLISSLCFSAGDFPYFLAGSAIYFRECALYFISIPRLL